VGEAGGHLPEHMEQTQASETSSLSNPCPDSPVHAFWAPLYLLMKGHCFYNKELDMCARGQTTTLVPEGVGGWQAVSLTTPSLDFDPPTRCDPHSSPSHIRTHTVPRAQPATCRQKGRRRRRQTQRSQSRGRARGLSRSFAWAWTSARTRHGPTSCVENQSVANAAHR